MKASEAITVINAVFPKHEGDWVTMSYTLNTESTNQRGVVRLTKAEFNTITNGIDGYPNAILKKINEENNAITED